MTRCAFFAEGRALGGLDGSAQHFAGMAERRLLSVDAGDLEAKLGVVIAIVLVETPAAFGNDADAAPGAIGDFKNFRQQFLRGAIAIVSDDTAVGVFDFVAA